MEFSTILKGKYLKDIKLKVAKLGGSVVPQCTENIAAVFAFEGMVLSYSILLYLIKYRLFIILFSIFFYF